MSLEDVAGDRRRVYARDPLHQGQRFESGSSGKPAADLG